MYEAQLSQKSLLKQAGFFGSARWIHEQLNQNMR